MENDKYDIATIGTYANIQKQQQSEFIVFENPGDFYHISKKGGTSNSIKIPVNVPRSYITLENNTILRISVAQSIQNCIIGVHGHTMIDRWGLKFSEYNIYKIAPEVILKPSINLVSDANMTGEYWLVNYDGKHDYYTLDKVGTLVGVATYSGYRGDIGKTISVLGLHLFEKAQYDNEVIPPGYYKITYSQDCRRDTEKNTPFELKINDKKDLDTIFSEYYSIEKMDSYLSLKSALIRSSKLPF